MRRLALATALAAFAQPALAAPARLSEAQVRAFVERQSKAWNGGDLTAYFALFTPDARFRDQALGSDDKVYPYGTSSLAEARARSGKAFAGRRIQEATTIRGVTLAPDGRSANLAADVVTTIAGGPGARRSCARREQVVVATPQGPRSTGETDTVVRCR
ncbi:MAG: hypothetical protein E7812_14625 [Phenylobacterium sp.]|nr:MAG: hypothetical protein E7812_14625 [Phenylobacterium sp.]